MLSWLGSNPLQVPAPFHLSVFPAHLDPWIHPHFFLYGEILQEEPVTSEQLLSSLIQPPPHVSNEHEIPTTFTLLESSESPGKYVYDELSNNFLLLGFVLVGLTASVTTNSILNKCESS